jgi:pilus assembly protein Flp/PilA
VPEFAERVYGPICLAVNPRNKPDYVPAQSIGKVDIMNWLRKKVLQLSVWKDTSGQDLVEYALAAGMVAVAAVACMPSLSSTVNDVFTKIGGIINNNVH